MKTVLVTGIGGPAGCNIAELLLQQGFRVVGTDMQSLAPEGVIFHRVPAAGAPGFLPAIRDIALREKVRWIIPTVTEELIVFADGWKWNVELPVAISACMPVETTGDKYATDLALQAAGIPVPRFALPSRMRTRQDVAVSVGWPCIVKPRIGRGGRGVSLLSEDDWPAIAALEEGFLLQEFIEGAEYGPNLYLGKDGRDIVVVLEKTALKGGVIGNALSVVRVEAPDVASLALAAACALGLSGPLDIDIRRRKDGSLVVLEINARFGANIRHAPEIFNALLKEMA